MMYFYGKRLFMGDEANEVISEYHLFTRFILDHVVVVLHVK